MTTTRTSTTRTPVTSLRKTSLVAGGLYLITFVSIPTLALFAPALAPGFIVGPGPDTPILIGGVLEIVVALAGIGTALALYPVVRRQNEGLALGFVASRTLEAATIFTGVVTLLAVVTLRQAGVGAEGAITAQALVALREWTTLLGQGFIPAMNALLLGTLLYRSRLVPRILPIVGLIGAPLLVGSDVGVLFEFWEPVSTVTALAVIPIALWEFSLGVYLIVRGFRPSPITTGPAASAATDSVTA